MSPCAFRRIRVVLAFFMGLVLLLSAGCAPANSRSVTPPDQPEPTVPVAESNWRNRLSFPAERVTRNWVLPDNTMLVELEYIPDGMDIPHTYTYAYDVYDPKTDRSAVVIPVRSRGMLRRIGDRSIEFVCDDFLGLQYLKTYNIAARDVSSTFPAYPVSAPRQFGISNAWMRLQQISVRNGGIELALADYPSAVPWMKVSGDESSRTLTIELPGLASESQAFGPLKTVGAAEFMEAATVEPLNDPACSGVVIRIKTSARDWNRLSYSLSSSAGDPLRFTLQLHENVGPTDLGLAVKPPDGWADRRRGTEFWTEIHQAFQPDISKVAELSDGVQLLSDGDFFGIYDPKSGLDRVIAHGGNTPTLASVTGHEVLFFCRGGGGGPCMSFPYFRVYDIATRSLSTREMDLALTTPVEVGGSCFTYAACAANAKGITFSFKEGPIMAGGGGPPTARTWADAAAHVFFVEFPGAITDGLQFGPLDLGAAPFVQSASLVAGVRGKDGETAPGVTVCLTLDAAKWTQLTYHIDTLADSNAPKPDYGYSILSLTFSDQRPATNIDILMPD